ncbi:hypothetical protein RND81_02G178300 [Saponaria officinalis]|uniref:YTH domain-containing family protein n=1 Tax=Saponaria officinalis TaxID=3572 RepID=A0AAW1MV54_SAPOF
MVLPNSAEQATATAVNGIHSNSTSSAQCAASPINGEISQESIAVQDVYNPPANYYNYYYPGYNASFSPSNDGRDHQSVGAQVDPSSIAYYLPGYNPYAAGTFVGADGCVSQPYYTSSGYVQTPVTYGTEAVPCYAWDMNSLGNPSNGSNITNGALRSSPAHASRSNGIKPSKLYGSVNNKLPVASSNSKSRPLVAPNYSQPKLNKAGSYYQTYGYANAYPPTGNFQPLSYQRQSLYENHGSMGYKPNVRSWNGNDKLRPNKKYEFEMSSELTCGPRGHNHSPSDSSGKEADTLTIKKDKYNLAEFETEYEAAKCYVIKSYSEDDVHKSIKYDVWSSTANGNKKLDAAFHDAEAKAKETGKKCPIFLFFSVNGSGQFVGVAEMIGKVDFDKTMDFWQMDKWSGFFPVKWHIVKDVPNTQLRHILLENNENRPVTYTRDTQEIGLKQGSEMLKIFKSYSAKTSLLDDFDFYESREKTLQMRRSSKSGAHQTDIFAKKDFTKQLDTEDGEGLSKSRLSPVAALVNLTNNLSLNADPKVVLQ